MLVRCLAMMRGGGETRHLAWARELGALGVDVDIIAGRPLLFGGPRYPIEETSPAPVTLLRSPYARDFVYRHQHQRGFGRLTMTALHADEEWFCRAAWRHIAASARKPDVVHAHALYQAARVGPGDIPVVINLPGEPNPRYDADLQRADALVADGWAAANLPRTLGRAIDHVPKGVDCDRFRPDGPTLRRDLHIEKRRVVITVSRLVPIKNVVVLIEAFAIVREHVPHAHLLVVGDGPEGPAARTRAAQLGVLDAVTFTGSVPHADLPAFYRTADVFALASDFDNSPNAILEAMASGLPIVATDAGGARGFVDDPTGGVLVGRRDERPLARELERFLAEPEAARAAGAHNRTKALTEFSWRASAIELLAVYRRVVGARRGAAERASA